MIPFVTRSLCLHRSTSNARDPIELRSRPVGLCVGGSKCRHRDRIHRATRSESFDPRPHRPLMAIAGTSDPDAEILRSAIDPTRVMNVVASVADPIDLASVPRSTIVTIAAASDRGSPHRQRHAIRIGSSHHRGRYTDRSSPGADVKTTDRRTQATSGPDSTSLVDEPIFLKTSPDRPLPASRSRSHREANRPRARREDDPALIAMPIG